MLTGWSMDVLVPVRGSEEPMRIRYVVARPDEAEARALVAKQAKVPAQCVETVNRADEELLLDFGLEAGEITRLEIEKG
jgi:hypothetical protein